MISIFFDAITRLSLRFRWVTVGLSLAIMALGVWAMTQLNLELLPRIEFPQTVVVVQWPDAESADQFLQEVTIPLENALGPEAIPGVVNVESTTSAGFAFIVVRNDFGLNQDVILQNIEEGVAAAGLPETAVPQVLNFSLSDLPVVVASVSSANLTLPELKALVQNEIQPQLEEVARVSQVTTSGGQELPQETAVATAPEPPASEPTPTPEPSPTADPNRLPLVVVQGARAFGLDVTYASDVTPEVLAGLQGSDEDVLYVLGLIPQETLRYAPLETIALLPVEFMATLDPEIVAELDALAADLGGVGQYTVAEVNALLRGEELPAEGLEGDATPEAEIVADPLPEFVPVPLPETWVAGAAQLGQSITDTGDITVEFMTAIVGVAPEQLAELTPEMWRALDPEVTAVALKQAADTLEPDLLVQLRAIQRASQGKPADPVALPESWTAGAQTLGITLKSTADITIQMLGLLAENAPMLLADLTPEMLLALPPDASQVLPDAYVEALDAGLRQTLTYMNVAATRFAASQAVKGEVPDEEDDGRLPDLLIQGASMAGLTIEFPQDITPEMMRLFAGLGEQGVQALALLTPDNLRLLQPEVIALLPAVYIDTLDAGLRAELDELAAAFGGAGALAQAEAAEAAAMSADAPALGGVWAMTGPNGEEPLFKTAADFINNPFAPTAAALLNSIPTQSQDPVRSVGDLTVEVMAYLAENEEGFVANLEMPFLELLSPDVITYYLETYPDAFDAEVTARLAAIARGEAEVFVPEASVTRTDGNPSVLVSIYKDGDANTVEVAHAVFDLLAAYEATNPGVETNLVFEQATFIEDSVRGVSREGALGAGFAVVVILLFLSGQVKGKFKLSWRATLVTAVSIPLSIFTAFLLMRLVPVVGTWLQDLLTAGENGILTFLARLFPTSVSLNIMTLSGMTVAIGRVVDDSIVVLENSYRYIQKGYDPKEAVLEGTREVAVAIFSATVTTIAVFLPLGLIGGLIGSFFLPFGLTVTYALAASFVVSITVVPALTYLLIRQKHIPEETETTMQRWYTPSLEWALRHRFVTMMIATVIFLGSLFLLGQLPQSFIPAIGEPTINVTVNLPGGTMMVETDAVVAAFETAVADLSGIETVQTEIGSAGGVEAFFGGGGVTQNVANLTISVADQDDLTDLTLAVRQQAAETFGAENVVVSAASQTGFGGFSLILTGEDLDKLRAVAGDVKAALADVDVDGDGVPDIVNVTSNVEGDAGGDDTIIRVDGRSAISFSADLETQNTLGVTAAAKDAVAAVDTLPPGVEISEGFESEQQVEGFRSMITAIGYSVIIVYLIMALTFRSLVHPFTILFSLPFALVGAALALFLTNSVLGISAMIGLMMLVGIVVTNGIVLMELVQQLRKKGENAYTALVQGGRTRLRPIWMTALTAVLALIPLAASQEAGAIIASELARAVMGGLLVSTLLTLIVVPVVYSLLDDLAGKLRRK